MKIEKVKRKAGDPRGDAKSDMPRVDQSPSYTRPALKPIQAGPGKPPETAIGERIKHARNELKLNIEALARYSANFDKEEGRGISATTLLRYEAGDPLPGSRELRILSEALDVPAQWLLLGDLDNAGEDSLEQALLAALEDYVRNRANEPMPGGVPVRKHLLQFDEMLRLKWIQDARNPKQKG